MNIDEQHHVALPKLYGAPAYARPPRIFDEADRPPDPDDLPLETYRPDSWLTGPSQAPLSQGDGAPVRVAAPSPGGVGVREPSAIAAAPTVHAEPEGAEPALRPRIFSVRALREYLERR